MTGLGEIIQVKRKELGLTQERLAEKIGKTAGYIGQIERELSYPSYPVLLQLIESFNRFLIISLDVLICRYSPLFRAFPALFISEEPHKSFYYPSCFHSQK